MTTTQEFTPIEAIELMAGSVPEAERPNNPELILIRYPETAPEGPLAVHAYKYCFLERKDSFIRKSLGAPQLRYLVDPDTICERRKKVVASWIRDMLQYKFSKNTSDGIGRCLDWIDERRLNSFIYEKETAQDVYQNHTNFLLNALAMKQMSYIVANKYQCNMRAVLEYSTGVSKKNIKGWAQPITGKDQTLRHERKQLILQTFSKVTAKELLVGSDHGSGGLESPETFAIRFPATTTTQSQVLYIFQYCFLKRERVKSSTAPPKTSFYVDQTTLCQKRRKLVSMWAQDILIGNSSFGTALITAQCFNWIDGRELNNYLYDEGSARQLYQAFSTYLSETPNEISLAHSSRKQCAMRAIIEYSTGISVDIIKNWAVALPYRELHPHQKIYVPIEVNTLRVGADYSEATEFKPESVVIEFSSAFKIPAFRYCYLDRLSIVEQTERIRYYENNVNVASLSKLRVDLVHKWAKDMLSNHIGRIDSESICSALDWIDINGRGDELHKLGGAQELYKDFSTQLLHALEEKTNVAKKDRREAIQQQKAMRYLASLATSEPLEVVGTWATEIFTETGHGKPSAIDHLRDVETYELVADSSDRVIDSYEPERVILKFGQGRLLIFRYCYLRRGNLFDSFTNSPLRYQVDPRSLCIRRCKLIKLLVDRALSGVINYGRLCEVLRWLDRIDKSKRHNDLLDIACARQLYNDFTNKLIHGSRLSRVGAKKGISPTTARLRQTALIELLNLAINAPKNDIELWAKRISGKESPRLPQPRQNDDQAQRAFEIHRRFFSGYYEAVINDGQQPLVIELTDLGYDDYIAFHHLTSNLNNYGFDPKAKHQSGRWRPFAFSARGFNTDELSVIREVEGDNYNLNPFWLQSYRNMRRQLASGGGRFDSDTTRVFANRAIKHFGYMLMYVSGCNAGHLSGLVCEESFLPRGQGSNRIVAFKNRPSTEKQQLAVDNKFQKQWRQMIKLRSHMAQLTNQSLPTLGLQVIPLYRTYFKTIDCHNLGDGLAWPAGAPSLDTKTPRKIKIQKKLELTGGDIDFVASMVSNTPETIRGHYAFNNFEDSATQMTHFFNDLRDSANIRISGVPEAPIVEDGEKIPPGKCIASSLENRIYITGIDESRAPELTCGGPLGCLFCASFGICDAYEDIHRLLSVKAYIKIEARHKTQPLQMHAQKLLPAVARIDEIIDAFALRDQASNEMVERAVIAIEKGSLDEFWFAQVNSLLDAMETV